MMYYIFAILAGLLLPVQTCVNTKFAKKSGSSFYAVLFCFLEALIILYIYLGITCGTVLLGLKNLAGEPWWVWMGGVCGVIFITAATFLNSRLGVVQTVVLPVAGQIVMGLLIDHFSWFNSSRYLLNFQRILGAALVFAGVVVITLGKSGAGESKSRYSIKTLVFQIMGVVAGMFSAMQTAINTYDGKLLGSSIKATCLSFETGFVLLVIISLIVFFSNRKRDAGSGEKVVWWMWTGGLLGLIYVYANIYLASLIGTAVTILILLCGTTVGGLVIDNFGLFDCQKQKINIIKIIGIVCLIAGVALVK